MDLVIGYALVLIWGAIIVRSLARIASFAWRGRKRSEMGPPQLQFWSACRYRIGKRRRPFFAANSCLVFTGYPSAFYSHWPPPSCFGCLHGTFAALDEVKNPKAPAVKREAEEDLGR